MSKNLIYLFFLISLSKLKKIKPENNFEEKEQIESNFKLKESNPIEGTTLNISGSSSLSGITTISGLVNINNSGNGNVNIGNNNGNVSIDGTLNLLKYKLVDNKKYLIVDENGSVSLSIGTPSVTDLTNYSGTANINTILNDPITTIGNSTNGLTVNGGLTITSNGANITGDTSISGNLTGLTGLTSAGNVQFSTLTASGNTKYLIVDGLGNLSVSTATGGSTDLTNYSGTANINTILNDPITTIGNSTNGLTVNGGLTITSNGANITGDTSISGNLTGLTGLTLTSGNISTPGNITADGNIQFTNYTALGNTKYLIVDGLGNLSVSTATGGSTDLSAYVGSANINTTGNTITTIGNSTNGLTVNGGLTITSNGADITGNTSISGNLTGLTGLTSAGNVQFSTLTASGNTKYLIVDGSGNLSVSTATGGSTDLSAYVGSANINTTGNTITTIGNSTNGLTVNGGLTITSNGANITGDTSISGNLNGLTGLTLTSGDISTPGNITAGGPITSSNGLFSTAGGANITGNTYINGDTSIDGTLNINGNNSFNVNIGSGTQNIYINSSYLYLNNLLSNNLESVGNVYLGNTTGLTNIIGSNILINGPIQFTDYIASGNTKYLIVDGSGNLSVSTATGGSTDLTNYSGTANINTILNDPITTIGNSTNGLAVNGGLTISSNGANITGNTSISGNLTGLTGLTLTSGNISTPGNISANGNIQFSNYIASGNTKYLIVDGLGNLSVSTATGGSTDLTNYSGTANINTILNDPITTIGNSTNGLTVNGGLTITSNGANITGDTSISGNLTGLTGLTLTSGNISTPGNITADGNIQFTNYIASGNTKYLIVDGLGNLSVSTATGGSTDLSAYVGAANINTTGNTITTIGNSTNGLAVNGGLTISSNGADITGDTSISGNLTGLTGLTLTSGDISTPGNITADGPITSSNGLFSTAGGANITGNTYINGDTSIDGTLNINGNNSFNVNIGSGTQNIYINSSYLYLNNLLSNNLESVGNVYLGNTTGLTNIIGSNILINGPIQFTDYIASGNTKYLIVDGSGNLSVSTATGGSTDLSAYVGSANINTTGNTITTIGNSTNGLTVNGGLTITSNGANITGDTSISGNLTGLTGLTSAGNVQFSTLTASGNTKYLIVDGSGNLSVSTATGGSTDLSAYVGSANINTTGNTITTIGNSTNGLTVNGGLTITSNGADITGDTSISGNLTGLTGLTLTSGNISTPANITTGGSITSSNGLFSTAGGADITGNTSISGNLTGLTGLTLISGDISTPGNITTSSNIYTTSSGTITSANGLFSTSGGLDIIGDIYLRTLATSGSNNYLTVDLNGKINLSAGGGGSTDLSAYVGTTNINTTGTAITTIGNPSSQLNVDGPFTLTGNCIISGNCAVSGNITIGNSSGINTINTNNTNIGNLTGDTSLTGDKIFLNAPGISTISGPLYVDGTDNSLFVQTSSINHKTDIRNFNLNDETISNLNPIKYKYKKGFGDNGNSIHFGFLAEELIGTELNDLVLKNKNGEAQGINYIGFIAIIIKKLIEVIKRLNQLEIDNTEKDNYRKKEINKALDIIKKVKENKKSKKEEYLETLNEISYFLSNLE